jgi:hypothetical protein
MAAVSPDIQGAVTVFRWPEALPIQLRSGAGLTTHISSQLRELLCKTDGRAEWEIGDAAPLCRQAGAPMIQM